MKYHSKASLDPFNAFIHKQSLKSTNPRTLSLKDWTVAIKDNIAVKNWPLTCASRALESYIAPYSADVVVNLLDSGAEIVGKTNLDEFGMG